VIKTCSNTRALSNHQISSHIWEKMRHRLSSASCSNHTNSRPSDLLVLNWGAKCRRKWRREVEGWWLGGGGVGSENWKPGGKGSESEKHGIENFPEDGWGNYPKTENLYCNRTEGVERGILSWG